ncbi:MAG: hypothetical protein RR136_03225 [Clostridia bacterium]
MWQIAKRRTLIKRINVFNTTVWAVNPAYVNVCKFIPPWLYEAFKDSFNAYLPVNIVDKYRYLWYNRYNND